MAGEITHTFTGTGVSTVGDTSDGKTLVIATGDNSYVVNVQVSYDAETSWVDVAEFNEGTAQNFVWTGSNVLPLRFECTEYNGQAINIFFK